MILNSYSTQTVLRCHLNISKDRMRKIIVNELIYNDKYYIELYRCSKELINTYNKPINIKNNHNSKSIKQINPITNEVVIFKSLKEIETRLGFAHSTINIAIHKKHMHGGFLWEYYEKS